jgi:nitroreductase
MRRGYSFAVLQTILGRRSIRWGFDDRSVPDDVVEQILHCGLRAPSSKNAQPWRIHVVSDRALLSELARAVLGGRHAERYVPIDPKTGEPRPDWDSTVAESAEVLARVPLGLFVENRGKFSDGRRTVAEADDDVRASALIGYGFEMIGLGAAIQSMWLAASELGLVGVFMGDVLIAEEEIRTRLGMRGDLAGVLALGYSDGIPSPKELAPDRIVRH